ncbi:hypothetical protein B0H63DRAFT_535542 [Podospora didyma]|uniref:Uncharacterized protein n=1 Tax=Podospora didyma TaxID=330526 RepID=A0AAE0K0V2_9PEZI|nr:hypothetical protein B0H63DRAFT_535542 [Podospora didyma]
MESPHPTLEAITASLSDTQKGWLHETADLLLEIYRTLARMRYLDPEWILPGPHDVEALIPMYRRHKIDDCIIYLYSIMPYIDTNGTVDGVDFFERGTFADFRTERDVKQGRDPFYEGLDNEDPYAQHTKPWMTPLSMLGNHGTVIIYSAKTHFIWIWDQHCSGSVDPNRDGIGWPRPGLWVSLEELEKIEAEKKAEQGAMRRMEENGGDEQGDDADMPEGEQEDKDSRGDEDAEGDTQMTEYEDEQEGSGIDEEDDEEHSGDEEDEWDGIPWDDMGSRPAPHVLQDMVKWYTELTVLPGGGEHSTGDWDAEITKPLYQKHGWPGHDFDGDAFLADKARAYIAADIAKQVADAQAKPPSHVYSHEGVDPASKAAREKIAAATTVEDEWMARWELFRAESLWRSRVKKSEDVEAAKTHAAAEEEVPMLLLEMRKVEQALESCKGTLKRLQADNSATQAQLRHAELQLRTYRRAYEEAKADVERLYPGRKPLPLGPGEEAGGFDLRKRVEKLTPYCENTELDIKETREWLSKVPQGAKEVREVVMEWLEWLEDSAVIPKQQLRYCAKALAEYTQQEDGSWVHSAKT